MAVRNSFWVVQVLFLISLCNRFAAALNTTIPAVTFQPYNQDGSEYSISINVPSPSNNNDLFFHVAGPSQNEWLAWGFGTGMAGSLIFVAYPSSDGQNVTVSPRLGMGHFMPKYTSAVNVTILEGTQFTPNGYVVMAHCTNCRSWPGASITTSSTSQPMIWAAGPQGSINSNDLTTTIGQHDEGNSGTFNINLQQATGLGGVPQRANTTSGAISTGPDGHPGGKGLHAFLMIGGFLVVLPAGYLALRVFEKVWLHWAVQTFGAAVVVLGSFVGIAISKREEISPNLTHPHQIIGLVALFLILITWIMGILGHLHFKKTKVSRVTIPQKSHRFLGPSTMTIGLINGFIGFAWASNFHALIGDIVFTVLMLLSVGTITFFKRRGTQRKAAMNSTAAQNFRQGQMEPQYAGSMPDASGQRIPLQTYNSYGAENPISSDPRTAAPPYSEAGDYYAPPAGPPNRI